MRFARYFSENSQSYYWYNDLTKEYHYEKPEEIIKKEEEFNNDINDYWIKKTKKKLDKNYWFNERTGEYSWVDPSMFSDELKPINEKHLKESEKNEKTSDIEDLSNKVTNLKIEKKEDEKPEVQSEKSKPKPKKSSYSSYLDNNSEFKSYDIVNGNGIFTTIQATDRYDAMEQMRDIAQSLNPYD